MSILQIPRRGMMGSTGGGGILPPEYQQVEWIGYRNSNKFLALPINWSGQKIIKASISKLSTVSRVSVFPSAFNPSTGVFTTNPWGGIEASASQSTTISPIVTASDTFDFTDFTISLKNVQTYYQDLLLGFGYNWDGFCPNLRFKELEIYSQSADLLFQAIMCYRKSDGKIGIYDTVSNEFCESNGTWGKGADI